MTRQNPESAEQEFFAGLIEANRDALAGVLSDDFVLIDVMTGSEVPKSALLDVVSGGGLKFESIDRVEHRVRVYGSTAVITGRTEMKGLYNGLAFQTSSRYTHIFVDDGERWRMVAAQGTQIAPPG